jgi:hypothetical protein
MWNTQPHSHLICIFRRPPAAAAPEFIRSAEFSAKREKVHSDAGDVISFFMKKRGRHRGIYPSAHRDKDLFSLHLQVACMDYSIKEFMRFSFGLNLGLEFNLILYSPSVL